MVASCVEGWNHERVGFPPCPEPAWDNRGFRKAHRVGVFNRLPYRALFSQGFFMAPLSPSPLQQ